MNATIPMPTAPVIHNGVLLIPVPLQQPRLSSTGKTLIVGQITGGGYSENIKDPVTGKPIRLNLTAMVKD